MAINNIELGYGGNATIDGHYVLITSGSLSKSLNIPFVNPYDAPATEDDRTKVKMGDGVYSYSGSLGFDMSVSAVENLINSNFLVRNNEFTVALNDGHKGYTINNCKFDNVTFTSSVGALFTGSIGFQSIDDFTENAVGPEKKYLFDDAPENQLVKYWHTGASGVESFTITISQSLSPVYLNVVDQGPQYIRAGLWDLTFEVSAWDSWLEHTSLKLGRRTINILTGEHTAWNYNYGGQNETGSHSYTYTAYAANNSDSKFFSIT